MIATHFTRTAPGSNYGRLGIHWQPDLLAHKSSVEQLGHQGEAACLMSACLTPLHIVRRVRCQAGQYKAIRPASLSYVAMLRLHI